MFAFFTFLSSLHSCLLKFISLITFLGEVVKISGEVQSHPKGGAHLPTKSGLACNKPCKHNLLTGCLQTCYKL